MAELVMEELPAVEPSFRPLLKYESGQRINCTRADRALSSTDRIVVRPIRAQSDSTQDEWGFLTSCFRPDYSVPGMEFEMVVTDAHLKGLRAED